MEIEKLRKREISRQKKRYRNRVLEKGWESMNETSL